MRELITSWIAIIGLLTAALVTPARALPSLDLAVIVNAQTSVSHMSAVEVETIFTRTQTRWSNGTPIVPINAPAGSEIRVLFDRVVLRLDPDDVGRFWIDRRIRGMGLPPRNLGDPTSVMRVVEKLDGAIAYVPEDLVSNARVKIVARIRQGKVLPP
jgi:ABC-type phosphate transport system substrate-binding protein